MAAKRIRAVILIVLATASASAPALEKIGPTWSEVTGERFTRTGLNRTAAIIKSIDGDDTRDRVVKIRPGVHVIRIQSPGRKGMSGSDQELTLTVAACQRYYLNAQFASGVGVDWEPVVDHVEALTKCKPVP